MLDPHIDQIASAQSGSSLRATVCSPVLRSASALRGATDSARSENSLPALGVRLEAMLAHPERHSIGDYVSLIARLHAELTLIQPIASSVKHAARTDATIDDDDLAALFERELNAGPLSEDEIESLAADCSYAVRGNSGGQVPQPTSP